MGRKRKGKKEEPQTIEDDEQQPPVVLKQTEEQKKIVQGFLPTPSLVPPVSVPVSVPYKVSLSIFPPPSEDDPKQTDLRSGWNILKSKPENLKSHSKVGVCRNFNVPSPNCCCLGNFELSPIFFF